MKVYAPTWVVANRRDEGVRRFLVEFCELALFAQRGYESANADIHMHFFRRTVRTEISCAKILAVSAN